MEPLTVSDWQAGAPACSRKEGSNLFGPKKPRLCEFAVSDAYARNRWLVPALADRDGVGVTGQPILGIAGGLGVGGWVSSGFYAPHFAFRVLTLNFGLRTLDFGLWTLDSGLWTPDPWPLTPGP